MADNEPLKPAADKPAKKAAPAKAAAAGPEEKRHYSGTVLKRNADGDEVMSDYVDEDEEVVRQDDNDDN